MAKTSRRFVASSSPRQQLWFKLIGVLVKLSRVHGEHNIHKMLMDVLFTPGWQLNSVEEHSEEKSRYINDNWMYCLYIMLIPGLAVLSNLVNSLW